MNGTAEEKDLCQDCGATIPATVCLGIFGHQKRIRCDACGWLEGFRLLHLRPCPFRRQLRPTPDGKIPAAMQPKAAEAEA